MLPELLDRNDLLQDCPKCGKRALAKISDHRYQCVWCRFYRDLSRGGFGGNGDNGFPVFIAIAIIVALLIIVGG